jgi:N-acetylglucosaminyl-diphospho-decaprenol L-rhamnosyltransferase
MNGSPTLTLSIVSHGQGRLVTHLLYDLLRFASPNLAGIILTLNLPERPPSLKDLRVPLTVIRNPKPLGFAANHNQAFARVESDHFAVLNPDIRLHSDPFPALLARLEDPNVAFVSPVILEANGTQADFARELVTPVSILQRRLGLGSRAAAGAPPEWLAGMFLTFRSDTYAKLGGFDPGYFLYCEDVDLCARARLAGYRFEVAGEAHVFHHAQRASRRSLRPLRLHVQSLLRLWASPAYREYKALLAQESLPVKGRN